MLLWVILTVNLSQYRIASEGGHSEDLSRSGWLGAMSMGFVLIVN